MADEPETGGQQAQATPQDNRSAAIAEARVEMAQRGTPVDGPQVDPEQQPEATPPGTGVTDEVNWADPDARAAHLRDRYLTKDELDKRLRDQKNSFKSQFDLAAQAQKQKETQALLADLDRLAEEDPAAYIERSKQPDAAAALLERANSISPTLFQQASTAVASSLAAKLFEVRPELEAVADEAGEKWAEVTNPETGGIFGYLQRTALDEGKRAGVEDFKKSQEFKDAIAAAERRGAQGAIGSFEVGTPASETGTPIDSDTHQNYSDPAQAAVAEAARALGLKGIDISKIRSPGRRPVATR